MVCQQVRTVVERVWSVAAADRVSQLDAQVAAAKLVTGRAHREAAAVVAVTDQHVVHEAARWNLELAAAKERHEVW